MTNTIGTEVLRVNTHTDPSSTSILHPNMNSFGNIKTNLSSKSDPIAAPVPVPVPVPLQNPLSTPYSNETTRFNSCFISKVSSSSSLGPRYNCIPDWARDMRYTAIRLSYIRGEGGRKDERGREEIEEVYRGRDRERQTDG